MIVILTGWRQDEDRQRSTAAGFDGHMVKPVELSRPFKTDNRIADGQGIKGRVRPGTVHRCQRDPVSVLPRTISWQQTVAN